MLTPHQFASNSPVLVVDLEGLESSDDKNETEKTDTKDKPEEEKKALDPNTVGKNFDESNIYCGRLLLWNKTFLDYE